MYRRYNIKKEPPAGGPEVDMIIRLALLVTTIFLLSACQTGGGLRYTYMEIQDFPQEIQEKIRGKEAVIGMTPAQVRYALGSPASARTFSPEQGRIQEEWRYTSSMGIRKIFVVFEKGEVVRIETEELKFPTIRIEDAEESADTEKKEQ